MDPLKIYMLPFPTPGHMTPLLHLARALASRRQHVTVLTTPANKAKIDCGDGNCKFDFHTFKFPSKEVDLPEGVENLSSATDLKTAAKICEGLDRLQPEIAAFLEQNPPDIFVPDIMFMWTSNGVPRLVFNPTSIFLTCIAEAIDRHRPQVFASASVPFVVPDLVDQFPLPHPITLDVIPSSGFEQLAQPHVEAKHNTCGVIASSFYELEAGFAEYYEKHMGVKVWDVGLLCPPLKDPNPVVVKDHKNKYLSWLDLKEDNSVVYICFGSLCRLSDDQLFAIAQGIEASGHGFLWVVHRNDDDKAAAGDSKWLPQGLEEKMRKENRGIIAREWVPQVSILQHPAVGAFLTHCGWNSVAEGITAGLPLITMPGIVDQFVNEKLVTQVHRIGVEVGVEEWGYSPYAVKEKVVSGELIKEGVRRVMDGGEDGCKMRSRAKEMQDKAGKAVQEGGSSYNNLTALIQTLQQKKMGSLSQKEKERDEP